MSKSLYFFEEVVVNSGGFEKHDALIRRLKLVQERGHITFNVTYLRNEEREITYFQYVVTTDDLQLLLGAFQIEGVYFRYEVLAQ